jgi:hypothetical protein
MESKALALDSILTKKKLKINTFIDFQLYSTRGDNEKHRPEEELNP